jgi:hypothetical protein
MTIELPLLRLGLAGFSAEQQQAVETALRVGVGEATVWEIVELEAADAIWVNGGRTQTLPGHRIRIASGAPQGRSLQVNVPEVGRPLAFALPVPAGVHASHTFDLASVLSMGEVLQQFEAWLAPLTAQFCLASHIVEHQSALGSGKYELRLNGQLLALVDMQGEAAVLATAGPAEFEGAAWGRRSGALEIPEHFARASLAELMWQYAVRTQRDVLPKHYRTSPLYFRRAPRLPQRLLKDSQLLVMRELLLAPATFGELQQRCGLDEMRLTRDLSALYFVGSITSNPKRAAQPAARLGADTSSPGSLPSGLDSVDPSELAFVPRRRPPASDLTAPAPIWPR